MDELDVIQQIRIARAIRAGVAREKIAEYFGVTLAQVDATAALDREFCKADAEFAAWVDANTPERPSS